jgi:hypothetical protein
LSSILEALKKAERESAPNHESAPPLPAAMPEPSPYPPPKRRWWLPLTIVVLALFAGTVFWQVRRSDPPPAPTKPSAPAQRLADRSSTKAAPSPAPSLPATADTPATANPPAAAAPRQAPVPAKEPDSRKMATATVPTDQSVTQSAPSAPPPVLHQKPPAAASDSPSQPAPVARATEPLDEPVEAPPRQAAAVEVERRPPAPPPREPEKKYRSDPRIELQALVWAPEAAARFVVINNRLIKEGGSIDNITVVRIDRDDVLLSEGGDRWYEKFKIR